MKTKISILIFLLSISFAGFSQTLGDFIDVVYLKNGSIVKGIITEQIPGESVKVKTADGSEFVYNIEEVAKFTREEKVVEKTSRFGMCKTKKEFKAKDKGYFAEINLLGNSVANGLSVTQGYRFSRFANFGLSIAGESIVLNNGYRNRLPVVSLNLVYSGELLNRRITPFYQLEAGYGFSVDRYGYNANIFDAPFGGGFFPYGKPEPGIWEDSYYYGDMNSVDYGGPMGSLTLGVKFHTAKKVYFKLGLDARLTSNFSDVHSINYIYDENYENIIGTSKSFYKDFSVNKGVGARFTVGF
jgi:hypothetical protein